MANPKKGKKISRLWLTEQHAKDLKEYFEIVRGFEEGETVTIEDLDKIHYAQEEIIQILYTAYKEGFFEL